MESLGSWLPHSNVVFSSQSQGVSCGGSEFGELVLLQVPVVTFLEGAILPLENRESQSHSLIPAKITLLTLHLPKSQNLRLVWLGRDLKAHLVPWAGTPSMRNVIYSFNSN